VGRELRDRTLGDWLSPDRQPAGTRIGGAALLGKLLPPAVLLWGSGMAALLYLALLRGWSVAGSMAWIAVGLAALVAVSLACGAALVAITLSLRTALSGPACCRRPHSPSVAWAFLAGDDGQCPKLGAGHALHPLRKVADRAVADGAPVVQTLPVVAGLLLATLVLFALASAGLSARLRRPEKWGGR
jgi:ABC-2 type transport system permease protein